MQNTLWMTGVPSVRWGASAMTLTSCGLSAELLFDLDMIKRWSPAVLCQKNTLDPFKPGLKVLEKQNKGTTMTSFTFLDALCILDNFRVTVLEVVSLFFQLYSIQGGFIDMTLQEKNNVRLSKYNGNMDIKTALSLWYKSILFIIIYNVYLACFSCFFSTFLFSLNVHILGTRYMSLSPSLTYTISVWLLPVRGHWVSTR